jgi:hypothetical protein
MFTVSLGAIIILIIIKHLLSIKIVTSIERLGI